jgi:hypothetical protein
MKNNYFGIILLFCSTFAYPQEISNAQSKPLVPITPPQNTKTRISTLPVPKIPDAPLEQKPEIAADNVDKEILYTQISQLLQSLNLIQSVEILKDNDIPQEDVKTIVQNIMNDVSADEYYKTALLFALAATPELAKLQEFFFGLIDKPETKEGYPILWIATESELSQKAIPAFLQYISKTKNKESFKNIVEKAVRRTIDENDTETLAIIQPLVTVSPEQATQFLWQVVQKDKNAGFVDLLKKMGASIDNVQEIAHTNESVKKTPLMLATENDSAKLVRALLNAGANPDFAPAHDSIDARFIALDKGFTEVQEIIRDYSTDLE